MFTHLGAPTNQTKNVLPSGADSINTIMSKKQTNETIDKRLNDQTRPITRLGEYYNNKTKMKWQCDNCSNIWESTADKILNTGTGCPICSGKIPVTNKRVDDILSTLNISRLSNVVGTYHPIKMKCNECKFEWEQKTTSILNSRVRGCPVCSGGYAKYDNSYVDTKLANTNIKRIGNVSNSTTPIKWECGKCDHIWTTTPNKIIRERTGCPKCSSSCRWSAQSIRWLNKINKEENIQIHHAENGGEFRVPSTTFFVDGYCKENNTIYEFHGDQFHGNPSRFDKNDKCHPYDKSITAGELYENTLSRENRIRRLGYNLVTIWESDFNE